MEQTGPLACLSSFSVSHHVLKQNGLKPPASSLLSTSECCLLHEACCTPFPPRPPVFLVEYEVVSFLDLAKAFMCDFPNLLTWPAVVLICRRGCPEFIYPTLSINVSPVGVHIKRYQYLANDVGQCKCHFSLQIGESVEPQNSCFYGHVSLSLLEP